MSSARATGRRRCTAVAVAVAVGASVLVASTSSVQADPAAAGTDPPGRVADHRTARLIHGQAWVTVAGVDSDRDGRADVVHVTWTRPAGGKARPVVVEPSPYYGGVNGGIRYHDVDVPLYVPRDRFATSYDFLYRQHGYAFVQAESPGTGRSTGCPTTGGPNETAAMVAVVDWLNGRARAVDASGHPVRARWSNGNVGMIGVSYGGALTNAAASTGVRGLKAVVPIAAVSHWYGYFRAGGAVVAPGGAQGRDADLLARYVLTRRHPGECRAAIRALRHREDRVTGDVNPFWARRDYRRDAHRVRAAVLLQHGMADFNVKTSQFASWYHDLRRAGVPHRLWLHPQGHGDFASNSHDAAWRRLLVDWFDRWLRDRHNGVMSVDPVIYQPRYGRHRRMPEWPALSSVPVPVWPGRGGHRAGPLRVQGGPVTGVDRIVDNASRDARQLAGKASSSHRLLYRTARLRRSVELSGTPTMALRAAFAARAANVSVALVDMAPGGHVRLVTEGWLDPQNRASAGHTRPVRPGKLYDLDVRLQPVQATFPRHHRIGLVLLQSDHDFTLRPPPGRVMSVRLGHSRLRLPVPGGRETLLDALP